ncbi:MAG: HNH endonuclease, partial [Bacilli bacterium]|nr:HNH endonuclease [Bacilli bacterium]
MEDITNIIKKMGYNSIEEMQNQIRERIYNNLKRSPGTIDTNTLVKIIQNCFVTFDGECPLSDEMLTKDNWHLDHVIPVFLGGFTEPWNLLPICNDCNLEKSSMHLLDYVTQKNINPKRVEKVFVYLINNLKINNYKINNNLTISDEQTEQVEDELINRDDNLFINTNSLDSITFFYQVYKYLEENQVQINGKINDYHEIVKELIKKNNDNSLESIENQYAKQNELKNFLKEIGVNNYYALSYDFSNKINDINE